MENPDAFFRAVQEGDIQTVEHMLAGDRTLLQAKNPSGASAVLIALYYGHPAIAHRLIAEGANPNVFEASAAGRVARVRELLDADPYLVNAYAADGFQPLGLAAFFGHRSVVDLLLSRGAEVNAASRNRMQVMPLHSAVASQDLEISRALLEHGADVNARQADDCTPLHEAAQNGQVEMVELLLAYGADKQAKKSDGQTALSIAQEKGYNRVASLLG